MAWSLCLTKIGRVTTLNLCTGANGGTLGSIRFGKAALVLLIPKRRLRKSVNLASQRSSTELMIIFACRIRPLNLPLFARQGALYLATLVEGDTMSTLRSIPNCAQLSG